MPEPPGRAKSCSVAQITATGGQAGDGREVVIAGLPGWDVRNAVGWMRGYGPELRPDLAVLCFSIGSEEVMAVVAGVPAAPMPKAKKSRPTTKWR